MSFLFHRLQPSSRLPQSPVEPVSLLSSSLIGQSSGGDAPLVSLPTLVTKPAGQYLDLTLL